MSVRMVRAKVKAGKTTEVAKAAKEMFAAIEAAQPQGVRYAACELPDGETYVILLELDDDDNNPLAAVQAFKDYQDNLKNWIAEPPGRRTADAGRVLPALLSARPAARGDPARTPVSI